MNIYSTAFILLFFGVVPLFQNCSSSTSQLDNPSGQLDVDDEFKPTPEVRENIQILSAYPNKVDLIYPESKNENTKAIVMLHGGGGNKTDFANYLGFKSTDSETYSEPNPYLKSYLTTHNIALIFVEGLSIPEAPGTTGWSNYVMNSGQDDKSFLEALASHLRSKEGFKKVYVMGHSMGGVMVNRLWCESSQSFDGFGSSAGPMAASLWDTCSPSSYKPYIHVTGLNDRILQIIEEKIVGPNIDHSDNEFLFLDSLTRAAGGEAFIATAPEFKNELVSYGERANKMCGETQGPEVFFPTGASWTSIEQTNCSGQLQMIQLKDIDHCTKKAGDYKCDLPLTTLGTTDHLDRFIHFFKAN